MHQGNGQGRGMSGGNGKDRIIKVPLGTVVVTRRYIRKSNLDNVDIHHDSLEMIDDVADESQNEDEIINDSQIGTDLYDYIDEEVIELSFENQSFVAARGGKGGRGNAANGRMVTAD